MADRLLLITWQAPARGCEERALEVFNGVLGILGRKQQEGKIESFDVALMEPNGELGGYLDVRGSLEQITALREDEEFRRNVVAAEMTVDGLKHRLGVVNEGVAREMALYQEAIAAAPQRA